MANTTEIYRRDSEQVTIMAYLGRGSGDLDEIRRIVVRDGDIVEDGIAYHGDRGWQWLTDQRAAYTADGFEHA
ncbi:hypothetical protein [Actinoplanes sp. GCM10030250]|uniref:hypothetical protein n=1 Tax=Actinoplanes sp. GCM10030250 TaxID=3273376 RepID=UPI0036159B63